MIKGKATPEGTKRYAARFNLPGHFKPALGLAISSIGLGSYIGDPRGYSETTRRALALGCNLIDTAINYHYQKSEREIGRGLAESGVARDEYVVCTKGGFIPMDAERRGDAQAWFEETLIKPGIVEPSDVVGGCHCMTPKYLEAQIEWSRKNLGLETVDMYYLHNPETQLDEVPVEEFEERIGEAFKTLEKAVKAGKIQFYGTATWNGYRTPPDEPGHLSLERLVKIAETVGGTSHHFKMVQLPYNLAMTEALTAPTQPVGKKRVPLLAAAQQLGMTVVTSVPLLQTKLLRAIPDAMRPKFGSVTTDAQRCLQFVRSTEGVLAPLVGMSNPKHVEENLATATTAPLNPGQMNDLLKNAL
jgi:aryl-alcohol dehydrogenase-like predicted oxidoreductase